MTGNSGVQQVLENTLRVLDAARAPDIPVAAGARAPLVERTRQEGHFHGADGLGGIELPATRRTPSELSAVQLLRREILGADHPVTLVALAPQTNLALLFAQHPEVADNLERIVFMGGSAGVGNVTAVAEFNVWQDPEAATAVIESGLPVTMYGLDVFTRLVVDQPTADRFAAASQPALGLAGELLRRRGTVSDGSAEGYLGVLGDAGAVVYLTDPDLFGADDYPVRANLAGLGRGQTIVDRRSVIQDRDARSHDPWPQIRVVLDLAVERAAARFRTTLERYQR